MLKKKKKNHTQVVLLLLLYTHHLKPDKKHTSHDTRVVFVCLQLRVIRAFKSTLEDLEERRSIHSYRTTTSSRGRPLSDNITYIDEEQVHHHNHHHNHQAAPPTNNKTPLSEG